MRTERKATKSKDSFWRACRFLWPHRRLLATSIVCALLVGLTFTGGLGALLPIMQVLVKDGTVQDWAHRTVADDRLGVRLDDEVAGDALHVMRVTDRGRAQGLVAGAALTLPETAGPADPARWPSQSARLLEALAEPQTPELLVVQTAPGQPPAPLRLRLTPLPVHHAALRSAALAMPRAPVAALGVILAVVIGLAVFGNAVRFFQEYYSEKSAILAVRDVRHRVYDHALHLPLSFFSKNGTSDVTSRLTTDAQNLQDGMKQFWGTSVQEPVKAAMALGLALYVSWELTLFILIFGPVMFLLIKKFGKHIRRAARAALQNTATLLGQIEGTLIGIRVVKAHNAERLERRRFRQQSDALVREQLRIARLEAFNTPTFEVLTLIVVCVIVLYAAYLVLVRRQIDNTHFFLVMACLMGIGESLRKTSKINLVLQKANAAASRLFELLDEPAERPRRASGDAPMPLLAPLRREVAFESVTFSYAGAPQPAVRDVSLRVARGESVAVVGRNGSGKTTLLALLCRFYAPDSGRIAIDGVDVSTVSLASLRRQIGLVTQDAVIFPGTIADNIAYGRPRATRQEIIDAARRAFAHEFITERPDGYDTVLGEHGAQLSGGQKQRLAIARSILRAAPILVLDEATSQVDAESEHLIQQAIESLMHERTTFVIAHRFSTILSADRIVVLEKGQVVGQGKHDELLTTCPTYRQLYERQLVGA